ncbi:MAG: bifunctional metallophosphatase/5'-nucleotidase [Clostridia bacterium]|nr:bifunctional metallophosphatase/5'-nucleotidase [Clostridia bacterium]
MDKQFHIRFTSDTHGYLYPTNFADTEYREIGLFRLIPEFPHDGNTLILDGGDTLQGSPLTNFYHRLDKSEKLHQLSSNPYGTHPIAAVMNLAGYQYITLGNHDFNYGLEELETYLGQLQATCLLANIRDRAHRLPLKPYAIHTLENGLRIGLAGVCTHYVRVWEHPETTAKLEIEDAFESARDVYAKLRDQCDFTILIYHGGYECDFETHRRLTDGTENQACQICESIGYDLVLTGHQHIAQAGFTYGKSYTVQPPYRADGACAIDVLIREDGQRTFSSRILPANCPPSETGMNMFRPLADKTEAWLDTPAGFLNQPLPYVPHMEAALHHSLVANFINTVQLDVSGAQISACALPNEYKGFTASPTIRDIVSTYIYSNTLFVLSISGADLKSYIERTAMYFDPEPDGTIGFSDEFMRPKVQHYNYDYFSGIDYTIDVSRPAGSRVTRIDIDGHPIDPDARYSLCINSYRHSGTAGYSMLPKQPVITEILTDVADAIIEYILKHNTVIIDTHRYSTILPMRKS